MIQPSTSSGNNTGGLQTLAKQFTKFAVIGVINTGIDFLILNALVYVTQIKEGTGLIPLNLISFTAAVVNSYYLNKRWAFQDNSSNEGGKKFSLFLAVSVIGALINTGVVHAVSTYIDPMFGLDQTLWLNVGKLAATAIGLIWNFLGYKLLVFKK